MMKNRILLFIALFIAVTHFSNVINKSGLGIFDTFGGKIQTLFTQVQAEEEHQIDFNDNALVPAVYQAVFRVQSSEIVIGRTTKIINKQ